MFKYKDVIFSLRSTLISSLNKIEGIGISRASYILDSIGLSRYFKVIYMTYYVYGNIVLLLKSRYPVLDSRLRELHLQRLEFFFSKNFVKGKRVFDGLPLGGRSHSNGATAARLKPFSEKYNEEIINRQKRVSAYAKMKKTRKKQGKK